MNRSPATRSGCTLCAAAGVVAPWLFLAAGALLSLLDVSAYLNQTAAYLVVIGLGIMAGSYVLHHLGNMLTERHNH
jgi:hypothetical protein